MISKKHSASTRLAWLGLVIFSVSFAAAAAAQTTTYTYDALGRVTHVDHSTGDDREYVYDDAGNIEELIVTTPPPNNPPVADNEYVDMAEGETITVYPLVGDTDPDGDTLNLSNVTGSSSNLTYYQAGNTVYITAYGATYGNDVVLTYTVSDGNGGTDTGSIIVEIYEEGK